MTDETKDNEKGKSNVKPLFKGMKISEDVVKDLPVYEDIVLYLEGLIEKAKKGELVSICSVVGFNGSMCEYMTAGNFEAPLLTFGALTVIKDDFYEFQVRPYITGEYWTDDL